MEEDGQPTGPGAPTDHVGSAAGVPSQPLKRAHPDPSPNPETKSEEESNRDAKRYRASEEDEREASEDENFLTSASFDALHPPLNERTLHLLKVHFF